MEIKFSHYKNVFSKDKIDVSLDDYIDSIKNGKYQDVVLKARAIKKDKEKYKEYKNKMPCITGSAIMNNGSRNDKNIKELNGLIVLDIDDEVDFDIIDKINKDKFTFISHRSFGGDGVCVFVKINPNKFLESFNDLGQYYYDNFNLTIDPSCKNVSRLRYYSYDPYLFYNEKSNKFIAKTKPKKIKKIDYVFFDNDFDTIISKIKEKQIDLCQDDYNRFIEIGFAIADKFGESGFQYFNTICSFGSKYDAIKIERQYKKLCRGGSGISISTFYYFCKQEGIEIYSDQTKKIISTVNVQKSQGKATVESVEKQLKVVSGYKSSENNKKTIQELIDSKKTIHIESEENETTQLKKFIIENYNPIVNEFTKEIFIDDIRLTDSKLNSIYLAAKETLSFNVNFLDVCRIIESEYIEKFNPIKEFFSTKTTETGYIDKYIDLIHPQSEYNRWCFKHWLVGAIHNWVSDEQRVCPLTLVFCGQTHGIGKTSFFRHLLPKELKSYMIEEKIDLKSKDSLINLTKSLIVFDDEFGGLATKDVRDFKKLSDINMMDIRVSYGRNSIKMKRRAILCGASNEYDIIKDPTGNRRILPINIEKVDYESLIRFDCETMLREAYNLYKSGYEWNIYKTEDIEYLNSNTNDNMEIMILEEKFLEEYTFTPNENKVVMNQAELMDKYTEELNYPVNRHQIKDIFIKNKQKYSNVRHNGVIKTGYVFFIK